GASAGRRPPDGADPALGALAGRALHRDPRAGRRLPAGREQAPLPALARRRRQLALRLDLPERPEPAARRPGRRPRRLAHHAAPVVGDDGPPHPRPAADRRALLHRAPRLAGRPLRHQAPPSGRRGDPPRALRHRGDRRLERPGRPLGVPMVSELFDPDAWDEVERFDELTDTTYHRARDVGAVRVAFDRPEVRNAFRPHTVDELYRVLDHARQQPDVGCVLLTGNGPSPKDGVWAFCSGGDQRIRGRDGYRYAEGETAETVDPARTGRLHILEVQRLIRMMP